MINKLILGTILALLGLLAGWWYGEKAYLNGVKEGMRGTLQLCSNGETIIMDKETGVVVTCSPIGTVPKEELNKFNQPIDKRV